MDELAIQLDQKLHQWQPDTSKYVKQIIGEIIELADQDSLDLMRSRQVEQSVLDLLDEA